MELRGVNSVSLQLWTQTCTHTDTHIQNQLCPLYEECLFNRTRLGFWKTLLLLFYFFCFYSLLLPQIVTFDSAVDPSDDPAQGNKWPWTHNLPLSYKSLISSIHILISVSHSYHWHFYILFSINSTVTINEWKNNYAMTVYGFFCKSNALQMEEIQKICQFLLLDLEFILKQHVCPKYL